MSGALATLPCLRCLTLTALRDLTPPADVDGSPLDGAEGGYCPRCTEIVEQEGYDRAVDRAVDYERARQAGQEDLV